MKVLITGGAGFIGSRLALRLAEEGHAVSVLDNFLPQVHGDRPEASPLYERLDSATRLIRGDVTDRAALAAALAGQEAVVHLAAETGTGQSMYEIERYSRVNIGGTSLLLDLLANSDHAVRRVVVASSRSIYGEGRYRAPTGEYVYPPHRSEADMAAGDFAVKHPGIEGELECVATDEDSKLHPSSVYGITKQVQEQLVMTVCPSLGIEGVALRYQNVFGPGQSLANPYTGILSIFANLIMQGRAINIFEDGRESRDFVYVDDVVEATVLALTRPAAANRVFNVGTGAPVSVLEVAETLCRLFDADVPIEISGNFRAGDIRHNHADLTRIRETLGFEPAWSFERGIAELVAWARASGPQASAYDASLAEMREKGLLK
ncbi:NAD-dependent epimerase/dehydratase family protein [Erythrobacter sp. HL-111]|uniref:NAD-dependent epimerase/dehydratase family protein n=1 Tax=Erythrobacter sp. HL-111 TaxID=1798193 RepID=UPI0006DAEFA9|nr:NAD-dependent epimerase/dehydratase family protein [Erythrobacter sp. HL-111]KPP95484.1 MAG: dTDP-L-rhamnose 4-epimerase WbiB [Erythrobacteraceae bacterium HL-111]SDS72774.1 dTDP-L-rhamnose 4-epimerase [Erythrobacter sp. HL-111]